MDHATCQACSESLINVSKSHPDNDPRNGLLLQPSLYHLVSGDTYTDIKKFAQKFKKI